MQLETPVLLLAFNRPDTTQRVFDRIKYARPKQLFFAADGARAGNHSDVENCRLVRQIATQVDWNCDLKLLFQEKNLGCGKAPPTAISWFFSHVEQGIILEDDCLPNQTFFSFCQTLLVHYQIDERVMAISGNCNFPNIASHTSDSYFFSKYPFTWGWATWRRVWENYDFDLSDYPKRASEMRLNDYWKDIFQRICDKKFITCWDYQFTFLLMKKNGVCICPSVNLVKNIGFDERATHTKWSAPDWYNNIPQGEIHTIIHPKLSTNHVINSAANTFFDQTIFCEEPKFSFKFRLNRKIRYLVAKYFVV